MNRKDESLTHGQFEESMAKLFHYLGEEFKSLRNEMDVMKQNYDNLLSAVDGYVRQVEIYHQESIARDARLIVYKAGSSRLLRRLVSN